MASAMEELDAAILLVQGAIERLRSSAPEDERLKFAEGFTSGRDDPEFLERFGQDKIPEWARGTDFWRVCLYKNYYYELIRP